MQIKIDMKILIFLLIFCITNQLKIYILLMIFACIHELGHMCFGKILGFKPNTFEVKTAGFSVSFSNRVGDYNKKIFKGNLLELKKIFVYFIGPLINLIIPILMYRLKIENALKQDLIYINLIIAIFNLLPIYPLDGGRILKSTLCMFVGLKKSYILINKISKITVLLLLIFGSFLILKVHNFGIVVVIILLFFLHKSEEKKIKYKLKVYEYVENTGRQMILVGCYS